APLSPAEEIVLAVERFLNSPEFKTEFPDTGRDVKVMGVRSDESLSLTVAMPFLCLETASEKAYFRRKEEALDTLARRFSSAPLSLDWRLNTLDCPGRGTEGVYLSLTGTSAEDGDSGQVGRGNRANGLIAFSRPSGGEAAPGKNPVAHVGKIYSVLSHRLAGLIRSRCPDFLEVYVHLAARIGEPVDQPWTSVQVVLPEGTGLADVEKAIREVVEAEPLRMPEFVPQHRRIRPQGEKHQCHLPPVHGKRYVPTVSRTVRAVLPGCSVSRTAMERTAIGVSQRSSPQSSALIPR
ncbi:MAG: hypothetical protein HY814_14795, partial [Candidatus Riflebacteria bacterium]|nr:hypothetical protein [Candidatus Riflebacteria bacterium]